MTLEKQLIDKQAEHAPSEEDLFDEVLSRFARMLDHVDFQAQLRTLNIGRFQFARKKMALQELRSMYVGLWKLALNSSLPVRSRQLFDKFLYSYGRKNNSGHRKAEAFHTLCLEYANILEVEGDTNFINVSILLCQHLGHTDQEELRRISLQLALDMRSMYHNIFERLI